MLKGNGLEKSKEDVLVLYLNGYNIYIDIENFYSCII